MQTTNPTEMPGRVTFLDGQNEMPMLEINTPWSRAELYLHGAHVTDFRKHGEPPVLFMSQCSRFSDGQPIRGGIPVIFPWFGMREGQGQHGFARVKRWDLKSIETATDGGVTVRLALPDCPEAATLPQFIADYSVTVRDQLTLQLRVTNQSTTEPLSFETCLHTYFEVGDVTAVSVQGLRGVDYLDKVANFARSQEREECIRFHSEVDRIYLNTAGRVEIHDPRLGRTIVVEKEGSRSTVVWNPWIAKAQQMPDFGNDEYQRMVCVESGNVNEDQLTLAPGASAVLTVRLGTRLSSQAPAKT